MYRIQLDPGPWAQYVKRADNVGLPLHEVSKKYIMESNLYSTQLFESLQQQQSEQSAVAAGAGQPEVTPSPTPSVTPSVSVTPSISVTPSATPSISPTPSTSMASFQAYNYVISGTDTALATGNSGGLAQYDGKVVVIVSGGYNCGNTTPRTFTVPLTAGSYNTWVCSPAGVTPVLRYYRNDVLVTSGLISTQSIAGGCPC